MDAIETWRDDKLEIHGLKQIVSLRFRRHPLGQVCYRRQPGKYVLNLKFTAFDPKPPFTTTWRTAGSGVGVDGCAAGTHEEEFMMNE